MTTNLNVVSGLNERLKSNRRYGKERKSTSQNSKYSKNTRHDRLMSTAVSELAVKLISCFVDTLFLGSKYIP